MNFSRLFKNAARSCVALSLVLAMSCSDDDPDPSNNPTDTNNGSDVNTPDASSDAGESTDADATPDPDATPNTPGAGTLCELALCEAECNDDACYSACFAAASPDAQETINELDACFETCASIEDDDLFEACLMDTCSEELVEY